MDNSELESEYAARYDDHAERWASEREDIRRMDASDAREDAEGPRDIRTAPQETTTMEIFRKVTAKGSILVVGRDDSGKLTATIDGRQADPTLRYLDSPKRVGAKVVVAQIDTIGLIREECDAFVSAWRGPESAPIAAKYEHAREYTAEDEAFDRGLERRETGE